MKIRLKRKKVFRSWNKKDALSILFVSEINRICDRIINMEYRKVKENQYLVRASRGEGIIASLKSFVRKENIEGGFFMGLGAVDNLELAHYSVNDKKYSSKKYQIPLEMASLIGSIGYFGKELIIHAHGVFGKSDMETISGHVVEARVSGTAEIMVFITERLEKFYDEETGLKLFNLKK